MAVDLPLSAAPSGLAASPPVPTVRFRELPRQQLFVELSLRLVAVVVYGITLAVMLSNWFESGRPTSLLLLMLTELFTLGLIVFARPATHRNANLLFMAMVTYTSFFLVFLDRAPTVHLITDTAATVIQSVGLLLSIWAKVALGRSYGILPAHRGLVTRGPYRFVRHPMYLGYLMQNVAFLAANASWRNLLVMSVLIGVQFLRMHAEERLLRHDDEAGFDEYRSRVPYRLLPRVY